MQGRADCDCAVRGRICLRLHQFASIKCQRIQSGTSYLERGFRAFSWASDALGAIVRQVSLDCGGGRSAPADRVDTECLIWIAWCQSRRWATRTLAVVRHSIGKSSRRRRRCVIPAGAPWMRGSLGSLKSSRHHHPTKVKALEAATRCETIAHALTDPSLCLKKCPVRTAQLRNRAPYCLPIAPLTNHLPWLPRKASSSEAGYVQHLRIHWLGNCRLTVLLTAIPRGGNRAQETAPVRPQRLATRPQCPSEGRPAAVSRHSQGRLNRDR